MGISAHDVNNKLGGIYGYPDMLTTGYESLSEDARLRFTGKAFEATTVAKEIIAVSATILRQEKMSRSRYQFDDTVSDDAASPLRKRRMVG